MYLRMHFWSIFFCLLYIFRSVVAESPELEFYAKVWAHLGLLISWDPVKVPDADRKYFNFSYEVEGKLTSYGNVDVTSGQYKLQYPLNEDNQYEITIQEHLSSEYIAEKNYTLKGQIDLKNISPPEKPYFKWDIKGDSIGNGIEVYLRIEWVPCGEEGNCHGNEPGTHFAVQLKTLKLRSTEKIVEYFSDYRSISGIYSGKMYEVTVISINGNLETSSDPQEAFLSPISSPVHSVRVLPLSNTSIYISWKQPKQSTDKIGAYVISRNVVGSVNDLLWKSQPDQQSDENEEKYVTETLYRFNGLEQNTTNTYIIIPTRGSSMGFEYRFDYSIQAIQSNLPLAKPDFEFMSIYYLQKLDITCFWRVYWLPCTKMFDCQNMNPGSGFELTLQSENGTKTYTENNGVSIEIEIYKNQTYTVIGVSVDEFGHSSESFSKTISCEN